jgi:TPR repeat protein
VNDQTTRPSVARQRYCCALSAAFLMPILLVPSVAVTEPPENRPQVNSVTTYTRYHIPDAERPALEQLALDGSADAAFRLYLNLDLENAKLEEKIFWVTIAAENGSVGAQHMLGRYLARTSKDPRLRRRARYWFKRAAHGGDKYALDELGEIEATAPEAPGK